MAKNSLSNEQIASLEYQIDQLYSSFERAVITKQSFDATWSCNMFLAYDETLNEFTNSTHHKWSRSRHSKRARVFDKYLLYFTIGKTTLSNLEKQEYDKLNKLNGEDKPAEKCDASFDILKKAIDDDKKSYSNIQTIAMKMAMAHDYAGILQAFEYIREKYPIPLEKK